MGRFKEFSKCCKSCGTEWNEDMSNKYPGRALCYPCAKTAHESYREKYHQSLGEHTSKMEKMQPFKVENRQHIWAEVNKEIRKLKDINEIHQFIKKQADKIFADEALMDFINHQSLK